MGIMARRAIRLSNRIIHMQLNKVWLVSLMAACAESHHIIFQKIFRFGGTVWIMAVDASFLHRIMLELCFGYGIGNILMAIKTDFVPCFQKDKLVFRGVRIMALYAIAFHNHFMNAFGILSHDPFMALIAYFVRIFVK